jgi:hypothetical protein
MKQRILRLTALLLSAVSLAAFALPISSGTCQGRVSKILSVDGSGDWLLIMACEGSCPSSEYTCDYHTTGWGTGSLVTSCRCEDSDGEGHDVDPPCQGSVLFDKDLFGPGIGGDVMLPCPPTCGPLADPRDCVGLDGLDDVPISPQTIPICECPLPI